MIRNLLKTFSYIDIEIYLPKKTLYINDPIPVTTLVQIKNYIKHNDLDIKNIIIKGGE